MEQASAERWSTSAQILAQRHHDRQEDVRLRRLGASRYGRSRKGWRGTGSNLSLFNRQSVSVFGHLRASLDQFIYEEIFFEPKNGLG